MNIELKDTEISNYQSNIDRLEKENHYMKTEITNLHVIIQGYKCEIKEKKQENDKLYKTLAVSRKFSFYMYKKNFP